MEVYKGYRLYVTYVYKKKNKLCVGESKKFFRGVDYKQERDGPYTGGWTNRNQEGDGQLGRTDSIQEGGQIV